MRLIDQLTSHPLLNERPVKNIFEPMGFKVFVDTHESPCPDEEPEDHDRFAAEPETYMAALPFGVPNGFTELARFETEDCEIVMVAVKPISQLACALMAPVAQEDA